MMLPVSGVLELTSGAQVQPPKQCEWDGEWVLQGHTGERDGMRMKTNKTTCHVPHAPRGACQHPSVSCSPRGAWEPRGSSTGRRSPVVAVPGRFPVLFQGPDEGDGSRKGPDHQLML